MSFEQLKPIGDTVSIATVLTAWLGVLSLGLTILATAAALVWSCIRIYETKTVQEYLNLRRQKLGTSRFK